MKTAVLLIGFGGPRTVSEVRPFIENVLAGVSVPKERIDVVVSHYEQIGNVSPYIDVVQKQAIALQSWLKLHGRAVPVITGFRHSPPFFKDIFSELKRREIERVVGVVLSTLRSKASFDKYVEYAERGRLEAQAENIRIDYTDEFYLDPLFIQAQASQVPNLPKAFYIFTAHSIPLVISEVSDYAGQFQRAAEAVASTLEIGNWTLAYQSRSGHPREAWLEPDIGKAIEAIDPSRFQSVCVVPIGFLCENVEILFDLDVQAKKICLDKGLDYHRASVVNQHPLFIEMMGQLVMNKLRD